MLFSPAISRLRSMTVYGAFRVQASIARAPWARDLDLWHPVLKTALPATLSRGELGLAQQT